MKNIEQYESLKYKSNVRKMALLDKKIALFKILLIIVGIIMLIISIL
jgi:hypothetical protein